MAQTCLTKPTHAAVAWSLAVLRRFDLLNYYLRTVHAEFADVIYDVKCCVLVNEKTEYGVLIEMLRDEKG